MDEEVGEASAVEVLDVIESFLVRRAIVGHEPTGLHAVFKRLWADLDGDISANSVASAIADHKTVAWPDDAEVRDAIATRPLYGSAITPFLLLEHDISHGGDVLDSIETIEHVLPQTADTEWKHLYGDRFVSNDTNALPNLVPCTGRMNASIGNQPYALKKARFAKDSKFKSTREFSTAYEEWDRQRFLTRANDLADWAETRFPYRRPVQGPSDPNPIFD
jgi:hypothetical protein